MKKFFLLLILPIVALVGNVYADGLPTFTNGTCYTRDDLINGVISSDTDFSAGYIVQSLQYPDQSCYYPWGPCYPGATWWEFSAMAASGATYSWDGNYSIISTPAWHFGRYARWYSDSDFANTVYGPESRIDNVLSQLAWNMTYGGLTAPVVSYNTNSRTGMYAYFQEYCTVPSTPPSIPPSVLSNTMHGTNLYNGYIDDLSVYDEYLTGSLSGYNLGTDFFYGRFTLSGGTVGASYTGTITLQESNFSNGTSLSDVPWQTYSWTGYVDPNVVRTESYMYLDKAPPPPQADTFRTLHIQIQMEWLDTVTVQNSPFIRPYPYYGIMYNATGVTCYASLSGAGPSVIPGIKYLNDIVPNGDKYGTGYAMLYNATDPLSQNLHFGYIFAGVNLDDSISVPYYYTDANGNTVRYVHFGTGTVNGSDTWTALTGQPDTVLGYICMQTITTPTYSPQPLPGGVFGGSSTGYITPGIPGFSSGSYYQGADGSRYIKVDTYNGSYYMPDPNSLFLDLSQGIACPEALKKVSIGYANFIGWSIPYPTPSIDTSFPYLHIDWSNSIAPFGSLACPIRGIVNLYNILRLTWPQ